MHIHIHTHRTVWGFDELEPSTNYTYTLQAHSLYGNSPISAPFYILTEAAIPPFPPTLRLSSLSAGFYATSAIAIRWEDPPSSYRLTGAHIDGYELQQCLGTVEEVLNATLLCKNDSSATSLAGSNSLGTYKQLTGLLPNSTYVLRVRAKSTAGKGEWSDWLQANTQHEQARQPLCQPQRPPLEPRPPIRHPPSDSYPTFSPPVPLPTFPPPTSPLPTPPTLIHPLQPPKTPAAPFIEDAPWETNATSLRIAWVAPVSYGLSISNYQLEVDGSWLDMRKVKSYVSRGLRPETLYQYRVRAQNRAGMSGSSEYLTASTGAAARPNTPTGLRSAPLCCDFSNVTNWALTWNRPSSDLPISSYSLIINGEGGWTLERLTTTTSITLTNLPAGSTFNATVAASSSVGRSDDSLLHSFQLQDPTVPGAPSNLQQGPSIVGISAAVHLVVEWDFPPWDGVSTDYYMLHIFDGSSNGNSSDGGALTGERNVTTKSTRYTLLNLAPEHTYSFAVRAHNRLGWGEYSGFLSLTTANGTVPSRCAAPRLGKAIAGVSDVVSIFVNWRAPTSIYYSLLGFELTVLNSTMGVVLVEEFGIRTTYLYRCGATPRSACRPSSTYYFSVRARNTKGYGDSSPFVALSTTPPRPPYTPEAPYQRRQTDYWLEKTQLAVL